MFLRCHQILISFCASLSVTSSGIGLGFPAITTQLLMRDDADVVLSLSQVSWFASVTAIMCPVGGPISGFLADKIGRRNTLVLVNVIAIISWLFIGFSTRYDAQLFYIELMIGRALMGIVIGMITAPAQMYVSEVCHPSLRGRMSVLSTPFFAGFGVLVSYFLGYLIPVSFVESQQTINQSINHFNSHRQINFRLVSHISTGITILTIGILFLIPESPVQLVLNNKTEKARKALALLRNLRKLCFSFIDLSSIN